MQYYTLHNGSLINYDIGSNTTTFIAGITDDITIVLFYNPKTEDFIELKARKNKGRIRTRSTLLIPREMILFKALIHKLRFYIANNIVNIVMDTITDMSIYYNGILGNNMR